MMNMKNRFFCILIAALFMASCSSNAQNVDANTFEQKINAGGVQVLDVRTAGEYNGSHLKNVLQADWTDKAQFVERTKYLDKTWNAASKPVVKQEGVAEMSSTAFNATVATNQIVLVDVGAEWCPPCKKMEPVLETLSKELQGKYTFLKVDGGRDATVMKEIGASVLPTFMVYKNGKLSWKKEGIVTLEELKSALTK